MKTVSFLLLLLADLTVSLAASAGPDCESPRSWTTGLPPGTCSGIHAQTVPPAGAIVVDATGTHAGSFKTVTEGVANIPNTTDTHVLFIFPGIYREQVVVPKLNGPLVMQGYTCDTMSYAANQVTITHAKAQIDIPVEIKNNRNFLTSTLGFKSKSGVKVYNLNVANTAGKIKKSGQAVAVFVDNTDYGFYACNFTGYQDTLCAHKGLELYARSYINGAVDFIFGQKAFAWFEKCDIEPIGKGWITANGNTNSTIASEYVFNKARVFSSNETLIGKSLLGRPWREYARSVFQNCEMSDVVNPEGWSAWNETSPTDNVYFKEFNNSGPGAATDKRVSFSGQLDAAKDITEILGKDFATLWWVDINYM